MISLAPTGSNMFLRMYSPSFSPVTCSTCRDPIRHIPTVGLDRIEAARGILANVGRYCRQVLDSPQHRNLTQEVTLEHQLYTWETCPPNAGLGHLYEAFRKHGLILLYRAGA